MAIVYIPVDPKSHIFCVGTNGTPVHIPPGTFQFLTKADAEIAAEALRKANPLAKPPTVWEENAKVL